MKVGVVRLKRLAEKYKVLYSKKIKGEISGITPPDTLITGSYPYLNLGILSSEELYKEKPKTIEEFIKQRLSFVNVIRKTYAYIGKRKDPFLEKYKEDLLSIRELDIEAKVRKPNVVFTSIGPFLNVKAKKINIYGNPRIPKEVDYIINESLRAKEAIWYLYNKGYSDSYLARVLSLGFVGGYINRKLVPSKNAITAVYSILIEKLEKEIKNYKQVEKSYVFYKKYFGNEFFVLFLPGTFRFELLEAFKPKSIYNPYSYTIYGKDEEYGGFYASKLSVLEKLREIKRQANIVVFRIVTEEYYVPLGVWVVREGVKYSDLVFKGKTYEALEFIKKELEKRKINLNKWMKYSSILKNLFFQRKLKDFII